jgi:hypothetical protein
VVVLEIRWGLLAIGFVFSFAYLWTFDKAWRATLGPAFLKLAGIGFGGVHGVGSVHPLGFLRTVNSNVEQWTANGLANSERGLVYSLTKFGETVALLFGVPLAIALVLYELAQYVAHVLPGAVAKPIVETVVKPITKVVKVTAAVTKAQFRHLTARVRALEHRIARLGHATAGAIAAPFPRIGRLEKTAKAQAKRLTRLEKILAGGLGVAVVARALTRLGLGWLRCGNVKRTGKAICGMNPGLLDALLLDAALLSVAFNLEEFARELQTVTGEAARLIHNFAD